MKKPAIKQPEMQIQKSLNEWQDQQRFRGNIFLFLCAESLVAFALFCVDPCSGTVWPLVCSLVLTGIVGALKFRAKHAINQHEVLLQLSAYYPKPRSSSVAAFGSGSESAAFSFEQANPGMFREPKIKTRLQVLVWI